MKPTKPSNNKVIIEFAIYYELLEIPEVTTEMLEAWKQEIIEL